MTPARRAGFHIGGGIAHEQTVRGARAQRCQRREQDVRSRLAGKAIGALYVIEVLDQSELFEDRARGGGAFGGGRALAAAQRGETFGHARVDAGQAVPARQVDLAILRQQVFHPLLGRIGKYVGEQIEQMAADVALEVIEGDGAGRIHGKHLLDGAADILGAVQQSAVDIEQVDRKRGDHAGWEPSFRPGTRRPLSGRITCCTPPPGVSFGVCGARV